MSAVADTPPLERWIARVRQIGAHRPSYPDDNAYRRLKADLDRDFPDGLPPADYDRAIAVIAWATGV